VFQKLESERRKPYRFKKTNDDVLELVPRRTLAVLAADCHHNPAGTGQR
jgi:hypothetical protein